MYLWNMQNIMTTNPVKFTYHKHTFSTAYVSGGSIYYLEDNTSMQAKFNLVQDVVGGSTMSEYTDNSVTTADGGFMYANVAKTLTLLIQKAMLTSNTAANNGGVVQFEGAGSITYMIDQCTVSSNIATLGSGALLGSVSTISKGTVVLSSTTISDNEARGDGGIVYLDGSGAKSLTIDSCTISNSKSTAGGGGFSWMKGSLTSVIV